MQNAWWTLLLWPRKHLNQRSILSHSPLQPHLSLGLWHLTILLWSTFLNHGFLPLYSIFCPPRYMWIAGDNRTFNPDGRLLVWQSCLWHRSTQQCGVMMGTWSYFLCGLAHSLVLSWKCQPWSLFALYLLCGVLKAQSFIKTHCVLSTLFFPVAIFWIPSDPIIKIFTLFFLISSPCLKGILFVSLRDKNGRDGSLLKKREGCSFGSKIRTEKLWHHF